MIRALLISCGFLFGLFLATDVAAQSQRLEGRGISSHSDKHHRDPNITARVDTSTAGVVKILVDAYVASGEMQKFPIMFQFFVNRALFSTQLRSPELPGAVGIDIGADVATPPFNFSVVATVLHPNRRFTSVINGAVFNSDLIAELDCTLTRTTLDDEGNEEITSFVANNVATTQPGDNQVGVDFETNDITDTEEIVASGAFTVTGTQATGPLTTTDDDDLTTVTTMNGTATVEENTLTNLDVSSDDGLLTLRCS